MLANIRIVLVNTSHPGNIGAAARAMKTMGLSDLYLVSPHAFPDQKATEMASGAHDLLERAMVVDNLDAALADCNLVVGTSARSRAIPWPLLSPRELAATACHTALSANVAIVFGREQSGLTNEELQRCHYHVQIPSSIEYSSLNLAAAVQVIAYEIRVASLADTPRIEPGEGWDYPLASAEQMEGLFQHLQQVLIDLAFLNPDAPRQLMARLRRLFYRARPDIMEMNILRGILAAIEKHTK